MSAVTGQRRADQVIVVVGRTAPSQRALASLVALLPLLVAAFRSERAAAFAELKVSESSERPPEGRDARAVRSTSRACSLRPRSRRRAKRGPSSNRAT